MGQKLYFMVVGLFFVLMNVFLWRAEFSDDELSVPVPMESVVRRLLETADDSTLEIRHHGKKIGYCRWAITLLTQPMDMTESSPEVPEGMVTGITGYGIDLDGNFAFKDLGQIRFHYSLTISTNHQWKDMHLRISMAPTKLEIQSSSLEETVRLMVTRDSKVQEYSYHFSDLGNPLKVFGDMAGTFSLGNFDMPGLPLSQFQNASPQMGLRWKAHTGRHTIGNSQVPVYQMEAPLLDKYKITIYMQKSGEILRVQLPDELELVNDKLLTM
jgi:hypothetical protein